jgi:hypothetical protein
MSCATVRADGRSRVIAPHNQKCERIDVPAENDSQRLDSDEICVQLDEGLRSCRTVVQNYRLMMAGDFSHLQPANDDDGSDEQTSTDA